MVKSRRRRAGAPVRIRERKHPRAVTPDGTPNPGERHTTPDVISRPVTIYNAHAVGDKHITGELADGRPVIITRAAMGETPVIEYSPCTDCGRSAAAHHAHGGPYYHEYKPRDVWPHSDR
jgi:hypothetical protein